jgi:hypothetical protein
MEIFSAIKEHNMKIKGLFIILALLGAWGCNNKSVFTTSSEPKDSGIIDEDNKPSGQLLDAELDLLDLTNDGLIIDQNMENYLSTYFPDSKYMLLDTPLNVNVRNINFAVHYIDKDLEICDIVVGFEDDNGIFRTYLLIKDFCFTNEDGSTLFDFSKDYKGIYGFNISYSYPEVSGYSPGLNIDTYFDDGNRVADTFTIMWNEEKKIFEKVKWF